MPSICDLDELRPSRAGGDAAACSAAARKRYPTKREALAVIPEGRFERSLIRSSRYLLLSLTLTIGSGVLASAGANRQAISVDSPEPRGFAACLGGRTNRRQVTPLASPNRPPSPASPPV